MAKRHYLGANVFDAAVSRMMELYENGDRVVVSLSGGKDSTCCLEVCRLAAEATGRLPVEAVCRDEEVIYPGVIEYLEWLHDERDDVELHWYTAQNPSINAFNREQPYWWIFDDRMDPDDWVRKPPPYAELIPEKEISRMVRTDRFPPRNGKQLVDVVGIRTQESAGRFLSILSTGGYMTGHKEGGARGCRPIYDWRDGDIWRAIKLNGWRYSTDYDVMHRMGVKRSSLRIGPPAMNVAALNQLWVAAEAWPSWWDRVQRRLPGIRAAAMFGERVLQPQRRHGEHWQDTFERECVDRAPAWIAERAVKQRDAMLRRHRKHATAPFPQFDPCEICSSMTGSWRNLAHVMYLGDPFSMKTTLPLVEPEFFRPGAGTFFGKPGV